MRIEAEEQARERSLKKKRDKKRRGVFDEALGPPVLDSGVVASIREHRGRVTTTTLVSDFFSRENYLLLARNVGDNRHVLRNNAPTDFEGVLRLTGLRSENFISDKKTGTVIVRDPNVVGEIHIGEAFVSSEYGQPLQALVPVIHGDGASLNGQFSSNSHYIKTLSTSEVQTRYGTLIRIYGGTPVVNGFELELLFSDRNSGALSQKRLWITPLTPSDSNARLSYP